MSTRTGRPNEFYMNQPLEWTADVASNASRVSELLKQDNAFDFVITSIEGTLRDNAGAIVTTSPRCFLRLTDQAGNLDTGNIPWEHVTGNGQNPGYIAGVQPILAAGGTLKAEFVNQSGAAIRPYITLKGYYRARKAA